MAELVYFTGPMDSGKSTLALQMAHTQAGHARRGRLFTRQDRSGEARVTSRIGLSAPAVEAGDDFDFWAYVVSQLTAGHRINFLVCDEVQFYTVAQVDELARIVDDLEIDVFAFGILADFRTELFPASKRLVELADRVETPQVHPLCWCGRLGTHNARVIDGVMITEGDQVAVGDVGEGAGQVTYQVLCRKHHRQRMTVERAMADPNPELLPLDEDLPQADA